MKTIKLSKGMVAMVSDEDYDMVKDMKWHVCKQGNNFYAINNRREGKKTISTQLHRLIMNCCAGDGKTVDHKDGNGLNCQRTNLRFSTVSQNGMNCRKRSNTTSKYKGVYLEKRTGKWVARIGGNANRITIGTFVKEKDAAIAFNNASIKLYGDFARINNV